MSYTQLAQNLSVGNFSSLLQQANINTGDTFWTGMYWMLITIAFISVIPLGWEVAFIMSFFGGLIIGMLLLYNDLINPLVFGMTEAILLFVVIYLIYSSNRNN